MILKIFESGNVRWYDGIEEVKKRVFKTDNTADETTTISEASNVYNFVGDNPPVGTLVVEIYCGFTRDDGVKHSFWVFLIQGSSKEGYLSRAWLCNDEGKTIDTIL